MRPPIVYGFTGSRAEPSDESKSWLQVLLARSAASNPIILHHGDCIGADAFSHQVALDLNFDGVVVHPPENPAYRAYCGMREYSRTVIQILPVKPYMPRNRDIVEASQLMLALPDRPHCTRSGTWSTVRYALRTGKMVLVPPAWEAELAKARKAVG